MTQSREERKILQGLSERASQTLEILQAHEQEKIDINPALAAALEGMSLTFVVFACLGTVRGKEELRLDLSETIFFKKFRRQAERLLKSFSGEGIHTKLIVILPDLEPRRTWGWQVPQEEITGLCELMVEDAASTLPQHWRVRLWSDIEMEAQAGADYDTALRWAMKSAPELILRPETQFFRDFGRLHPDIIVADEPETRVARKQIAAYAHEGRVLERLYPNAILLQTDTPVGRKDAMFNLLRREPLAIAHPFTR